MLIDDIAATLTTLRERNPLVHNITNYVTVTDCANVQLALGASPIMADAVEEMEEISAAASALVLNIGTLNPRAAEAMLCAGRSANARGIPVILDPVGVGGSTLRNETVRRLLDEVQLAVLRGNAAEISFIGHRVSSVKGVDSASHSTLEELKDITREVARAHSCVVALTGAVDIVTDGTRLATIHNGTPLQARLTGMGCATTALVGAWAAATTDMLVAAAGGVLSMGIAGDIARERAGHIGLGSFHAAILDALGNLDETTLKERAKLHEN
ncbi:MAG: hydroxyethylthiazole kinase [Deltaproteobacteria bacterium]|nr:hydroxyethylthiazole kinase [Deltaproteobacteria bacterium]